MGERPTARRAVPTAAMQAQRRSRGAAATRLRRAPQELATSMAQPASWASEAMVADPLYLRGASGAPHGALTSTVAAAAEEPLAVQAVQAAITMVARRRKQA